MEVKDKIREDQLRLRKLIEKIMKSITSQESQKTKAKAQFVGSLALGVFGAIGGITTCNGTAVMYGISTVANVISAVSSGTNIIMSEKILKALNDLLKKAFDLNKEIEDEIEELITELNSRIDEQPKFDLSRSNTSISTNLSNLSTSDKKLIEYTQNKNSIKINFFNNITINNLTKSNINITNNTVYT